MHSRRFLLCNYRMATSAKYSVRAAPGAYTGPAHVGLYVKRPMSPLVRANNVRSRLVRFFNTAPTYVNLTAPHRIALRAEFEQLGVTKTQLHKLAESVLDIRVREIASRPKTNAGHRHEVAFWAWVSLVTRRASSHPRPFPQTLVKERLQALIGRPWDPWKTNNNPLHGRRRW